ncbi:MAG: hypothetical protein ABSG30_12620 [Steroidobacteraceae bacterium]|jgi:hypothetical protein
MTPIGNFVQPRLRKILSKAATALVCMAAVFGAGCHGPGNISYYGIAWVTVTSDTTPEYAAYVVTIDSITLTRSDNVVVTAVATPEVVDLTQIHNIAEMWSSGAVPNGTYIAATITIDYTNAVIAVMKDGVPVSATVLDYATKTAPTTYAVTVQFDKLTPPTITPTYASTSAALMNVDFDLAASGTVDLTTSPPTVYVRPFMTIGHLPADTKLVRVRGALANSSTDVDTYTVYIRPFYDEANNIGQLTLFSQPSTVYTLNGHTYMGSAGLEALSVLSAGSTMTAGYTTFQPDYNPLNGAYAGRFNLQYVVAGSTLEDIYTEGITGDVIARSGNTLTLRGATLILTTADTFAYCVPPLPTLTTNCGVADAQVLLGPATIVTADDNPLLTGLSPSSIAVGDHIAARGIYSVTSAGAVTIDSTGTSSTNTGSVRLQPNEVFGTLVSSAAGGLVTDVSTIDNFPASVFNFAGNGATTPVASAFSVDTEGLTLPPGTVPGDPIWLSGYASPFGSAPPDFLTFALNNQTTVQIAGGPLGGGVPTTPGTGGCGVGSQVCDPAVMQVIWSSPGTVSPFSANTGSSFTINLANASLSSAVISIGPQTIAMASLPASPTIVGTALAVTGTFAPRYVWGNPVTSTTTTTVTSTTNLDTTSDFSTFLSGLTSELSTTNPAVQMMARGIYNPATNTFTATAIDFAL